MKAPRIQLVLTAPEAFASRHTPHMSDRRRRAFTAWIVRQRTARMNTRRAA